MKSLYLFVSFILIGGTGALKAQDSTKQWSLQECIEYAKQNNITVKRQQLNAQMNKNNYEQSKYDMLPSLNASAGYNVGFGRYLDKVNNEYVDQTTQGIDVGISSGVALFQGFVKQNNLKQERQNSLAAQELVKETENDISLAIAGAYLQILFDKELLAVRKEQYNVTLQQVERSQKLVDAGSAAMGTLLEIKAQLAKEALNVTTQENSLSLSLLNLAQFLDLESGHGFDIAVPQLPDVTASSTDSASTLYQQSLALMPQIKRSEYELLASKYQLKKANGYLYPTLRMGAGWNTQAAKAKGLYDWDFSNSLKNNANSYIGFSLSIPIFNGLQARTGVKNAKLGVLDAEYALQTEKLALRKEIEQANADASAAHKKYLSGIDAVASYQESFTYTQKRFEVGMVNSVDYSTSKNEYTRAQSELLQAKYEFIFKSKILDFYKGIPIVL